MTLYLVLLYVYLLVIHKSCQLLCYNGTLNNHFYEEDPLQTIELFNSNTKRMARLRCSLSILCKGFGFYYLNNFTMGSYACVLIT